MSRLSQESIEQLFNLGGQVIEPVDPSQESYRYYRGFNLGAVCLNLLKDNPVLNAGGCSEAHFSDSYIYAKTIAVSQTKPELQHTRQFSPQDAELLRSLGGVETLPSLPAMVVALEPEQEPFLEDGPMEGKVFRGALTVYDLDPQSQQVLTDIFPGLK